MEESVRIAKFSVLVDDICDLMGLAGLERLVCERDDKELFEKYHIDASLLFIFDYKIFGNKCIIGDIVGALIIFLLCLIPIGNIVIGIVYINCAFYNKEKFRELVSKR